MLFGYVIRGFFAQFLLDCARQKAAGIRIYAGGSFHSVRLLSPVFSESSKSSDSSRPSEFSKLQVFGISKVFDIFSTDNVVQLINCYVFVYSGRNRLWGRAS